MNKDEKKLGNPIADDTLDTVNGGLFSNPADGNRTLEYLVGDKEEEQPENQLLPATPGQADAKRLILRKKRKPLGGTGTQHI